jgi:hypothetical protein
VAAEKPNVLAILAADGGWFGVGAVAAVTTLK